MDSKFLKRKIFQFLGFDLLESTLCVFIGGSHLISYSCDLKVGSMSVCFVAIAFS